MVELRMNGHQDPAIELLLEKYPVFTKIEFHKLKCNLTNHELPYKLETLQSYVNTKKFLWEWDLYKILEENDQYFEDIGNNLIGCKITLKTISRDPKDLARHLAGKKFKAALAKKDKESKNENNDEPMDTNQEQDSEVDDDQNEANLEQPKKRKLVAKSNKKKVKRKHLDQ